MDNSHIKLEPCPFCGQEEFEIEDSLYPTGVTWEFSGNMKIYGSHHEYDNNCWQMSCKCGAEVQADTKEETVKRWNTRIKL